MDCDFLTQLNLWIVVVKTGEKFVLQLLSSSFAQSIGVSFCHGNLADKILPVRLSGLN